MGATLHFMKRALSLLLLGCASAAPTPVASSAPTTKVVATIPEPEEAQLSPPPPPDRFATRTLFVEEAPRYTGRKIDLDLKDADVANVCRLLADVGNTNIVLGDGVQGRVTLTMHRVPWDQALDSVLRAKGLRAERDGNVILVFAK